MEERTSQDFEARVPFRTVLASIVGLWLCYFLLTSVRSEVLGFGFTEELMLRRAIASLAGVTITLALWLVLRVFDARSLWMKIAAALLLSMPAAVAIVESNDLAFADIETKVQTSLADRQGTEPAGLSGDPLGSDTSLEALDAQSSSDVVVRQVVLTPWQKLIDDVFGRYFMMLAWCALYLALLTGEAARGAERREGAYRRAAKAAELRSLRYQVNPHFLFNTLNSLSALVLTGKTQAAERMIQTISTFYRRSLADDPTADVPLREEFALQKLYLDIEAARFPQRLRAAYLLPPELGDAKVPGMILQPLVENSVKHAVAPTSGRVTITLSAREEYGRLVIEVSDDGRRGDAPGGVRPGYGIGLSNVRERLEARFGAEAAIVSGAADGGYSTQMRLPLVRHAEEDA